MKQPRATTVNPSRRPSGRSDRDPVLPHGDDSTAACPCSRSAYPPAKLPGRPTGTTPTRRSCTASRRADLDGGRHALRGGPGQVLCIPAARCTDSTTSAART